MSIAIRQRQTGFAIRASALYAAIFLVVGTYVPYYAVWLDWRGLTVSQISIVFSAPLFVRVVFTPAVSFAADHFKAHRATLILLAWGSLCCIVALFWTQNFLTIFTTGLFFAMFWTSVMPLSEVITMTGVRRGGLDYGRMRLWGSLTFIGASSGGGVLIAWAGPGAVLWMLLGAGLALVAATHGLPQPGRQEVRVGVTQTDSVHLGEVLALLRSPTFLLFMLAGATVQAGHAVFYTFGTLHWARGGISTDMIGLLWTVGVGSEIAVFAVSGRIVRRFGPPRLIAIAGLAAIIRWTATALDPPLGVLFGLQMLHGLTFGAAHLGAIHFISAAVPQNYAGTAQGLYATIAAGLFMGGAMAASGQLYGAFAGHAYFAMAGLGALSVLASLALMRRWTGEPLLDSRRER